MATLSTMKTRIADELYGRSDLTSQIASAITSAVAHYSIERWGFNESVDGASVYTTANTAYVTPPTGLLVLDSLQLTTTGGLVDLAPMSWAEYRSALQWTITSGAPNSYVEYGDRVYLYPTPVSTSCTVVFTGVFNVTVPSNSTSNAWTNDLEPLIRERAKADVLINVIHDAEAVADMQAVAGQMGHFLSRAEEVAYANARRRKTVKTARLALRRF